MCPAACLAAGAPASSTGEDLPGVAGFPAGRLRQPIAAAVSESGGPVLTWGYRASMIASVLDRPGPPGLLTSNSYDPANANGMEVERPNAGEGAPPAGTIPDRGRHGPSGKSVAASGTKF